MKTLITLSLLILISFFVSDLINIIPSKPTKLIVEDNQIKSTKMDSSVSIPKNIVDSSDTKSLVKDSKKEETLNLSVLFQKLMKSSQKFSISPNSDTILKCKEGTVLSLSSNSFAFEDSEASISKNIDLQIKEFYKPSDFIAANLTTTTKDDILETAGTIYIEAFSEGKRCKLKNDQTIEIRFPYKVKKDGMELFTGRWTENNNIVWEKEQEKIIDESLYDVYLVDQKPEFPGGESVLLKYISANVKYPKDAIERGAQGTVFIQFVIDNEGYVKNPQVVRSVDPSLDKEAIRAVKSFPKWTAGKVRGQNVNVNYCIPIKFKLDNGSLTKFNILGDDSLFITEFNNNNEKTSINDVSNYILSSANLGWINCDRYNRSNKQRIKFYVKANENVNIKIVFNDFRSILPGYYDKNGTVFQNIPIGEKITIIALKCENNIPYIAIKQTVTSKMPESELVFEKVTLESLKEKIKILNAI